MNEVRRFVPRNLRDDGMIEAHEVAHYTHLNLSQYVSASDYDALAARVQAVERDNRTYIDERHELLTKNEALIQQLADVQETIAAYEQCQQEIARAVGYTEGQKLTRHAFILKTIGQAEQQMARLEQLPKAVEKFLNDISAVPPWESAGEIWAQRIMELHASYLATILRETGASS